MLRPPYRIRRLNLALVLAGVLAASATAAEDPPELNPFAKRPTVPEDAVPGVVELSDGTTLVGKVYLTRDTPLKIYDASLQRQRDVPLRVLQCIDCQIDREWQEKEWRFKENANNEKVYTGRSYPAREYTHTLTLQDGRTISGPLSAIVYVLGEQQPAPEKMLLHKRQHGDVGQKLSALLYVKRIELGEAAVEAARRQPATSGRRQGTADGRGD